jgi:chromosomal replication initiation ATPase DnaA
LYQYALNLKSDFSYLEEDFIEDSSNLLAKKWIDYWPDWQGNIFPNIVCIYGTKGSGKTHLGRIWQNKSSARDITINDLNQFLYRDETASYLVDDIEKLLSQENNLLHFINYIIENKKFLLITAQTKLHELKLKIPDLKSRLQSIITYKIDSPTDKLIEQMLVKSFSDHQIIVGEEIIKFLTSRIERNFDSIKKTVDILNKSSLSQNKKITIPFVKTILNNL